MKKSYYFLPIIILLLASCLDADENPALHYKANSTLAEKLQHSKYNWSDTKPIAIELTSPNDGIVNVRAINGEILYQGFLSNGILSEFILNIPEEIEQVIIEYEDKQELVGVGAKRIRFTF